MSHALAVLGAGENAGTPGRSSAIDGDVRRELLLLVHADFALFEPRATSADLAPASEADRRRGEQSDALTKLPFVPRRGQERRPLGRPDVSMRGSRTALVSSRHLFRASDVSAACEPTR